MGGRTRSDDLVRRQAPLRAILGATILAALAIGYFAAFASTPSSAASKQPMAGPGAQISGRSGGGWSRPTPGTASAPQLQRLLHPLPLRRRAWSGRAQADFIVDTPAVAHNSYLEVLAELGIPGILLFLLIIIVSIAGGRARGAGVRAMRRGRPRLIARRSRLPSARFSPPTSSSPPSTASCSGLLIARLARRSSGSLSASRGPLARQAGERRRARQLFLTRSRSGAGSPTPFASGLQRPAGLDPRYGRASGRRRLRRCGPCRASSSHSSGGPSRSPSRPPARP